jgi:ferrous iron transport protein B
MPEAEPLAAADAGKILLIGNPNVGKSVLFGGLTKRYVVVSNYPGTTVDVTKGYLELPGGRRELLDLPGVNNLIPQSEDERVTRDVLLTEDVESILLVADAKNLRRGLLIAVSLAEMGLPFGFALNMMDEAMARGIRIDRSGLTRELGVPVFFTVATRGKGLARIKKTLAGGARRPELHVPYDDAIEAAVDAVIPYLPEARLTARSLALAALAADEGIREWMSREMPADAVAAVEEIRRNLAAGYSRPLGYEITQQRLTMAGEILSRVYRVDPAFSGVMKRVATFGESVPGRGVAHVVALLAALLVLLSMGGFPASAIAATIAATLVILAVLSHRVDRLSPLVLLGTMSGLWFLGMAVRPLSDVLPEEAWFRSGWFTGAAAMLLISSVLLGRQATNIVWGTVGGIAVLLVIYLFVGVFGAGVLVDLLESKLFGQWVGPGCISAVDAILPFPHVHAVDPELGAIVGDYALRAGAELTTFQSVMQFIHDLLVGPFGALTMALSYAIALILPVVGTFFLVFGVLEDSGYLPRLAVMMNRGFSAMGLNGKAVLPMVLGLGCDTMATLTTRVLETKKERVIVTLLLALGVPCSAQLGVILGITSQIGTVAILWWVGTILVVLFLVGWLSSLLLPGRRSDFILELPPLRMPRLKNILLKTVARIEWYLKEAVPLFFLGTFILFMLDYTGALNPITWATAPLVKGWLSLPEEATPAFLIGFLRRDYGAAGLSDLWREGLLSPRQAVVALVTITLFVPCVANFFIMIKERGLKTGVLMFVFIFPFAFLIGGLVNIVMDVLGVLS